MIPKFRYFNKLTKEMVASDFVVSSQGRVIDTYNNNGWVDMEDTAILMQSTGLFDKNGVEIFEGDVVRWGMLPNSFEIHHRYAVVERNPDIQFRILYYIDSRTGEKREGNNYVFHFGSFAYRNTEDCLEIISNIHEHPDLVEVGHD